MVRPLCSPKIVTRDGSPPNAVNDTRILRKYLQSKQGRRQDVCLGGQNGTPLRVNNILNEYFELNKKKKGYSTLCGKRY